MSTTSTQVTLHKAHDAIGIYSTGLAGNLVTVVEKF